MRKTQEVLRLILENRLSQHEVARALQIGQPTVSDYLARFRASGLTWPLPDSCTERELENKLFPPSTSEKRRPLPDFATIEDELKRKHVTLDLLWREYAEQHAQPYSYSRFCHHYERWKASQGIVMRQTHQAGEKLFVDWAGSKLPIYCGENGEAQEASLFVAVLGASNYTYAEVTASEQLPDWIGAHLRAFAFFQGTPELLPDNTKTAVTKPCRYDPDLNPTYYEMAKHYGMGILPARVRKPRDKAKVEAGVLLASRWILARLRKHKCRSLEEANALVGALLGPLNRRPFKKRSGSRWSLFHELDQPALRPLPPEPYDQSVWSKAKVHPDHHVQVERNFYSVPYQATGETVEVRLRPETVEIFHRGERLAAHARLRGEHRAATVNEHRPPAHRAQAEWTGERIRAWAENTGPFTARLVESILAQFPHEQMGFRSCLGVLRRAERLPIHRVEAAAERTLAIGGRYKSFCSILAKRLDEQPLTIPASKPTPSHDNIRGPEYFLAAATPEVSR